jgi:hypothetical protein
MPTMPRTRHLLCRGREELEGRLRVGLPEEEGAGEGEGDALLIVAGGDAIGVVGLGGELDHQSGAGERVYGADGGGVGESGDAGAGEGLREAGLELAAGGDPGRLGGEPGLRGNDSGCCGQLRGVEVDAFAAAGGVEEEAGDCMGVVGDSGAVVEGERRAGGVGLGRVVGVAGHGDGEAAGGEQGAEAEGEGERDVLLEGGITDA